MAKRSNENYYIPAPTHWPIIGSIALLFLFAGAANWLHQKAYGPWFFFIGSLLFMFMLYGWFGTVIKENRAGLLDNKQVDRSFRWGMMWFIFTEVMFFAALFGVLFYVRNFSVPWLGGVGHGDTTHLLLWPHFHPGWPVFQTPDPTKFPGPRSVMETWGIPAINTAILLSSGVTITFAHWGVLKNNRRQMMIAQALTILLGIIFVCLQAHEYWLAYTVKGLMMSSGIYGATFFLLTGFHALHVTLGVIMLICIFYRMTRGDFNKLDHFGFEATAWYWHFVDVVWLALFIFVYWL